MQEKYISGYIPGLPFCRLCIACDNAMYGCTLVLKLDSLALHLGECEYNPKRPLPCEKGCGFVIPKDEYKDHNCVRELRSLIHTQQQKLGELKVEIGDQNLTINELKRELQLFKDFMRAMRVSNPVVRSIADQMERDEVERWSNSLARARVTRWGGMISTPDEALQVSLFLSISLSLLLFRWVLFPQNCVILFFIHNVHILLRLDRKTLDLFLK